MAVLKKGFKSNSASTTELYNLNLNILQIPNFIYHSRFYNVLIFGRYLLLLGEEGFRDILNNQSSIFYGTAGKIDIGDDDRIAAHCVLISANPIFTRIDQPIYLQGGTSTGKHTQDDVWIDVNGTIHNAVHLGMGVVMGAGGVIVKDYPEYSIAVGILAKIIHTRKINAVHNSIIIIMYFCDSLINKLE